MRLEVSGLGRFFGNKTVFHNISFSVQSGEVLFIRGPSGVGKSLLLRSLAWLDPIQAGTVTLNNKSPLQLGIPKWRSTVTYVHQTRVPLKGTPAELFEQVKGFGSYRGRNRAGTVADLETLAVRLGLEEEHVHTPWTVLSGGQAQRAYLAVVVALRPPILLLDEPTSACDTDSAKKVEEVLSTSGSTLIWITHDDDQPHRVGGRAIILPEGREEFIPRDV